MIKLYWMIFFLTFSGCSGLFKKRHLSSEENHKIISIYCFVHSIDEEKDEVHLSKCFYPDLSSNKLITIDKHSGDVLKIPLDLSHSSTLNEVKKANRNSLVVSFKVIQSGDQLVSGEGFNLPEDIDFHLLTTEEYLKKISPLLTTGGGR